MALTCRPYAYSKIQFAEDPEEAQHRRAQFLIQKILQKADQRSSRRSWWRVRVFKLKIKIGKRLLKKLKKGFSSALAVKQISCVLKSCKYLIATGKTGGIVRTIQK